MKKPISKQGFTMVEMLISLMVFTLGMLLIVAALRGINSIRNIHFPIEEEIAFKQLRTMMALSSELSIEEDQLHFFYLGKEATLSLDNDRLVRKDGYVVFLSGLSHAYFTEKKGCCYFHYERNNQTHERFLGCP